MTSLYLFLAAPICYEAWLKFGPGGDECKVFRLTDLKRQRAALRALPVCDGRQSCEARTPTEVKEQRMSEYFIVADETLTGSG